MAEAREVTLFRDYLRIKTVQPNPDYEASNAFLKNIANELDLPYVIEEMVPGKPIFVMTWEGLNPELPSILLNSHTDVVPVFPESWKYDPFEAVKEPNGDIYARGTQDMKCVGIQHIEAIRRLKNAGKKFQRTIHLSFIADEELGGFEGMAKFVGCELFKKMNVGLALDEGLASPDETMPLYYGERNAYWVKFHCKGNPGHGSRFIEGAPGEKIRILLNKLLDYREQQRKLLESDDKLLLGDVTSVNLTMLSGGVQMNVVPSELVAGFDIRISPKTNLQQFEKFLEKICQEAGGNIEWEFLQRFQDQSLTSTAESDPWFKAFKRGTDKHGLIIQPQIFPAGTDSRFLREVGIPAFGFSPMNHTPILLHDHNEFLNENIFMKGIEIFEDIIVQVASV